MNGFISIGKIKTPTIKKIKINITDNMINKTMKVKKNITTMGNKITKVWKNSKIPGCKISVFIGIIKKNLNDNPAPNTQNNTK